MVNERREPAKISRRSFLIAMAGAAAAATTRLPSAAKSDDADCPVLKPSLNHHDWLRIAEEGTLALSELMQPGKADLPIIGKASSHGAQADRLESFARPCLWAAHWLQCEDAKKESGREDIAEWFRRGLLHGTNPDDPEYWGPTADHHQHTVEMSVLTLSLDIARQQLWESLDPKEREQIAAWLGSVRGTKLHRNNHLFFGVLTLEFLQREGFGKRGDKEVVRGWLDELEGMAIGGGWFRDGTNETVDYYNAYAFHTYALWWGILYGDADPARKKRWNDWTAEFLPDYARFFAASGENVPFGRSLTYRFNAVAPFAVAEKAGISPLPPGQVRRLCSKNLEFFWSRPIRQEQGVIGIGWTDVFPALSERYSCGGSPYWCAKGLAPLLLLPSSNFWTSDEAPLPSEAGDFAHALSHAELVVRSTGGEIELANAGTAISTATTVFGPYKWGKLAYRTGVGFEVQAPGTDYPVDAALSAQSEDGTLHGRQATHALAVEGDHMACRYALGEDVEIETHFWWNGRWQLQLHKYSTRKPLRLLLGGQSLAAAKAGDFSVSGKFPRVTWQNDTHRAAMHALHGFADCAVHRVTEGEQSRTHIYAANSLAPVLRTATLDGKGCVVALHGIATCGENLAEWKLVSANEGLWRFGSEGIADWTIRNPVLPAI